MQVAVAAKSLSIIAHPCFQNILTNIWYRTILPDVSNKRLALAIVVPFAAPWVVRFQKRKSPMGATRRQVPDAENATLGQVEQIEAGENFEYLARSGKLSIVTYLRNP